MTPPRQSARSSRPAPRPSGKPSSRRTPVKVQSGRRVPIVPILLGGGVVLLAVLAIVLSSGGSKKPTVPGIEEVRSVTVTGAGLAPLTDTSSDPVVGAQAPQLTGQSFDGTPVDIKPGGGKPTVVIFVAHWCPHCQKEVPLVAQWLAQSGMPQGVNLYAVSTNVDKARPNYPPSAWLTKENFSPPVQTLVDDSKNSAAISYGLSGFPFIVYVDKNGRVAGRVEGEVPIADIQAEIAKLTQ